MTTTSRIRYLVDRIFDEYNENDEDVSDSIHIIVDGYTNIEIINDEVGEVFVFNPKNPRLKFCVGSL